MAKKIPGRKRFMRIVKDWETIEPFSTGQKIVNYSKPLYNVKGSTKDPKSIPGSENDSWKKLLENAGIGGSGCYVTNPLPKKTSSHPKFQVGGHMTPNKNGYVAVGSDSYLMPLCKWHNSKYRDEVAFFHEETRMIKLSGYMQGELASTFLMRSMSSEPFSLAYFDSEANAWKHLNLSDTQAAELNSSSSILGRKLVQVSPTHVLTRRIDKGAKHTLENVVYPE